VPRLCVFSSEPPDFNGGVVEVRDGETGERLAVLMEQDGVVRHDENDDGH
jgi:hypothetical protein